MSNANMFLPALTLAFAGLAQAQSASDVSLSLVQSSASQASSLSTRSSGSSVAFSSKEHTTSVLLPFYAPYPISNAPESTPSGSASLSRPSSSSVESAKFWQHEYRDYYASIVTVISTSTIVYAIDCATNSAHPLYSAADFQSFSVCAAGVVGRGPMTVTQGPDQWKFAVTQTEPSLNLTQSQFNQATTSTRLDVTCEALTASTKTCKKAEPLASSTAVVSTSRGGSSSSIDDGSEEQRESEISSLLQNFSTMAEVLVTVTAGVEKLPAEMLSSLSSEASTITTTPARSSPSASPSASLSAGVSASDSTGAAPRATGAVSMEVFFGAVGVLGAAVFGF